MIDEAALHNARRKDRESRREEEAAAQGGCETQPDESQDAPPPARLNSWPDAESMPDLSDHQREQYAKAAQGFLGILGGRPGTGKTFTLARILSQVPAGRCAVAAPTGKAAVRVTESLQKAGVGGVRATTIHSLLGPSVDEDGNWAFAFNEDHPLEDIDWIFVDEFSMCDSPLAGSLLAARPTGCRVMMIGDVNQLSPVGHGAPLRDLIAAGLPYGELQKIRRNSGRIVQCCHGIVDEHAFNPSPALDLAAESPENLLHIEKREADGQIECVKAMLERFRNGATLAVRNESGEIENRRIDPVWDCQILVPVNDKSPLARKKLNSLLQGFLNPGGEQITGNAFRVGDKIVCTKNGQFPVEKKSGAEQKAYVANGEQAKVVAVQPRYTVATLAAPDRTIRIPKGNSSDDEDGEESTGTGCNWELAYALSVHKSQGSQWPVVITIADAYAGARMLCDRCWIYTALSRAEIMAVTVGQREVIDDMCGKSHIWNRKTFLKETLDGLRQNSIARGWEEDLKNVVQP
jgi:exodeoxyribonuclease V alpha subunit